MGNFLYTLFVGALSLSSLAIIIFLIAWYLSIGSDSINTFMNFFMGIYFEVFGLSKIIDLKNFPKSFAMYDPIASNFSFYGWAYPFVELALGVMFLTQFFPFIAISIISRSLANRKRL